jgi:hypothetical protein
MDVGGATMSRTIHAAPLPSSALDLLRRADGELLAAQLSSEPADVFTHAHLAALRAAAAVLAVRGLPSGRRKPRPVWQMLATVAPEAADWATFFAAGAPLRLAVDAGRFDAVDATHAERTLDAAEDFLDEVRVLLEAPRGAGPDAPLARPLHALRAS